VRGNRLTYEFCVSHGVSHRNCGKTVVASSEVEADELARLVETGRANGLEGLRIIDPAAIRAREPHIEGYQVIEVPSTGIVLSEDIVKAYARVASDQGANIVTNAKVERFRPTSRAIRVTSAAGEVETHCLINSAGLFADADEVAALLGSKMAEHKIYPVRGHYCEVAREEGSGFAGSFTRCPRQMDSGLAPSSHTPVGETSSSAQRAIY